ncbi:hypothetical protein MHO82_01855 [Vibrio sp. Of7-15]|nr:hypothetical protein [Vibrio sp. Of7-15]
MHFKSLCFLLFLLMPPLGYSAIPDCSSKPEIRMLAFSWTSSQILTEIETIIIEKGFGCRVIHIPDHQIKGLITSLEANDIDIIPELWENSYTNELIRLNKEGIFKVLDNVYSNAREGWFIPEYLAQEYSGLDSIYTLGSYTTMFARLENEDKKIAFISCPVFWTCSTINYNLLAAFNLHDKFRTIIPTSAKEQQELIIKYIKERKPFVFYYWSPASLLGEFSFTEITMPSYNFRGHQCNSQLNCSAPYPSGYPITDVSTGVSFSFEKNHPEITKMLRKVYLQTNDMNRLLAWAKMGENSPRDVALHFLRNYSIYWTDWVPHDVKLKVKAYLEDLTLHRTSPRSLKENPSSQ